MYPSIVQFCIFVALIMFAVIMFATMAQEQYTIRRRRTVQIVQPTGTRMYKRRHTHTDEEYDTSDEKRHTR